MSKAEILYNNSDWSNYSKLEYIGLHRYIINNSKTVPSKYYDLIEPFEYHYRKLEYYVRWFPELNEKILNIENLSIYEELDIGINDIECLEILIDNVDKKYCVITNDKLYNLLLQENVIDNEGNINELFLSKHIKDKYMIYTNVNILSDTLNKFTRTYNIKNILK